MNNHKKYQELDIERLVKTMKPDALLFDGWQLFDDKLKSIEHINYESIGYKKKKNRLA